MGTHGKTFPLPADLMSYSTVRIECDTPEGISTGTGFFYSFCRTATDYAPAIITNKHVVKGSTRVRFNIHVKEGPDERPVRHACFQSDAKEDAWTGHDDPDVDLCAFPIGQLQNQLLEQGRSLYFKSIGDELIPTEGEWSNLLSLEEIVMVGYPNGLWDKAHNMPIFRRGVTATHPRLDHNGRREFMIDAACFPGSSGSPVFLFNPHAYFNPDGNRILGTRFKFLGVHYAGPQQLATGEIVMMAAPTLPRPVALS